MVLKSSMDRFIDTGAGTYEKAVDILKSSMDRFIAFQPVLV